MKWISVKDRLPEIGSPDVLCLLKKFGDTSRTDSYYRILAYETGTWWDDYPFEEDFERNGWNGYYKVTHWMPLPEPPDNEKGSDTP